jgi:hypothetical protein
MLKQTHRTLLPFRTVGGAMFLALAAAVTVSGPRVGAQAGSAPATAATRRAVVMARTLDELQPEPRSERAHDLQGERSYSGRLVLL